LIGTRFAWTLLCDKRNFSVQITGIAAEDSEKPGTGNLADEPSATMAFD
jgi:hypothetical protein